MSKLDDNRRKHDDLRKMVDEVCLRMTDGRGSPGPATKQVKDTARKAYYLGCRDGMELAREADKQPRKFWILGREYDLSKGDDVKAIGEVIGNCQDRQAPNDLALIASTLLSAALEVK
jgi:hypothetical protein